MNNHRNFLERHNKYLRYLLVLSFITFVILFAARAAHGAWYNASWQYRKKITIQSSQVIGGPHSDFPVLVKLATDAELAANARNDGYDILFTSSDETTKIAHEREKFDGGTGELVAWVKVDSVSSSGNTDIYMYYGNLSATDQQLVVPTKSDLWSDYVGVWHLHDDLLDSTSNDNDGTAFGSIDATGKIADGQQYDGIDDYDNYGNKSNLNVNYITVSFWMKVNSWVSDGGVLSKGTSSTRQYWIWTYGGTVAFEVDEGGNYNGAWNPPSGEWQHFALTYDGSNAITYRNGGLETNTYPQTTGTILTTTEPLLFGDIPPYNHGDVNLDEVRISGSARSAQWIQTEYNNQAWPNTADTPSPLPNPNPGDGFITVDTQTSGGGGGNQQPVADAGTDQNAGTGATVALDGSGSSDPDSDPLTYTWSFISKPGGSSATLSDPNIENPTFDADVSGTYELQLIVNDGTLDSAPNTVTITVTSLDLGSYSCNMKITIQGSQVQGGPHNDFPALISLTDESLKTSGCGFVTSDDGYDILFTDSTQSSQLAHEIEKYDKDTGELIAWVKVDLNASPSNTEIYMYYGNSGAGDQQNPTGVWNSDYVGVWHLKETTGTHYDSTSYGTNGTPGGGVIQDAIGKINGADDFDGNDDYVEIGTTGFSASNMTFSAWVRMDAVADHRYLFGHTTQPAYANRIQLYTSGTAPSVLGLGLGDTHSKDTGSALSTGTWYHVVLVKNATNYWVYLNSALDMSGAYTGLSTLQTYADIGNDGNPSERTESWNGVIDEVRVSDVARSADWIQTEYNNQNDPSSFYNVESPQCPDTTPPISEFTCSVPITIDSSKVAGTGSFTDFPVLISLTDTALKTEANCGYVEDSNGYDIIFSDSAQTTQLDHEVEKYDAASGELIAWVRIPTLSGTTDTIIHVHFGHSTPCGATESPSGVWDSNYKGVWHLQDQNNIEDSTSYSNDGTPYSVNDDTGKIGVGQDFDGNDYVVVSDNASLNFDTGDFTLEAWVNSTQAQVFDEYPRILDKSVASPSKQGYRHVLYSSTDSPYPLFDVWSGGSSDAAEAPVNIRDGSWHHLVGVKTASQLTIYLDGLSSDTVPYTLGTTSSSADLMFGRSFAWDSDYFLGILDEIRISDTARSADWIQTSYNNQDDPSSFYSVGASSCSLGGFSCNRRITIDSTKVEGSSDLTNFPFLIKVQNDCNLKTTTNGGAVENIYGRDIIFTDSDGITQLDHEIEEYDGTGGDLTAWIRIPTLPYNSDKDIYMYYGKSGLACDPSNPNGVWDSSYEAVYHLNDDFEDSTSHNRDATAEDTDNYSAVIADGEDFSPHEDIAIGNWNFSGDALTLQAWARFDDFDQNDPRVLSKASGTSEQNHVFMLGLGGNLEQHLRMRVKTGTDDLSGTTTIVDTDDPLSANNWYLIAGTYDGSNMRLLSNGVDVHSAAKTGNLRVNSWNIALGNSPGSTSSTTYSLDGKLDEVRILSVARSADWLKTEYNNQSDPDSFSTMSQDSCGGEYGFNFQYCKKIVVDHTQVDSDLTNFPLLINIANDDDLKTVANGGRVQHSQGWDIVFRTSGCGNLDHEIEKYDGSTGDLVAWVRVPTLSSSTDTEIYMYYGASNVLCSPENPAGVWDANFAAIWHLKEDPGGTAPQTRDSTANDNDATSNGSMTTADLVSGKIGNGIDFDGSNDWIESPNSGSLDIIGNEITLSAWVKSTADQNDDAGIINKSYSADYNYMLNVQSSDQGNFRVRTGGTSTYLTGATTLQQDQWYFLYGIYDGANAKVYLNGSEDGTDIRTGNIESSGDAPVVLGRRRVYPTVDDRFFTGVIDEVHISNVARTTDWMITEFRNQSDPGNFYTITSCFEQTTEVTQEWVEEVQ